MTNRYETVIIGAGLSGLAAGIRLAHFDKRVLIVEAHSLCGGLNSWYKRQGKLIDVGLHAMTNYIPKGGKKGPLTKLLRQLRVPFDDLELCPQKGSRITFPNTELTFDNTFITLQNSVTHHFPDEVSGFLELAQYLEDYDEVDLNPPRCSARNELGRFIHNSKLIDMLLTPLMFYGNPDEGDMDFAQFAVMWKSIYCSGFARPRKGMKHVIERLVSRFKESGGELLTNVAVNKIVAADGTASGVELSNGTTVFCDSILSCAGHNETIHLIDPEHPAKPPVREGQLSFVEQVFFLDRPVSELGLSDSIIFFNHGEDLVYKRPVECVDYRNGVICCPGNFEGNDRSDRHELRITLRASYPAWKALYETGEDAYDQAKQEVTQQLIEHVADQYLTNVSEHITFSDLFTPLTIERFSGHTGGAVYGSPDKRRSGETSIANLKLIGTDQGFLGIVGAMLSGITIANQSLQG